MKFKINKHIIMSVKAKKHLGQHFLKDENIAKKIADKNFTKIWI